MAQIPESVIEKIREGADIVEVASGYFKLTKAGRNFKALCPFHQEKTPSFVISPDKQIFHCFGCGAGGNVINLVMKMENMPFPEAVRSLGQKLNVAIVTSEYETESAKKKETLFEINEKAAEIYHTCLLREENRKVRSYLDKRGLAKEIIEKFKIGYAPGGGYLVKELTGSGTHISQLREAGLAASGEYQGHPQDYFRRRLMFPIFDLRQKVLGFGGRILEEGEPKYLNTAETQVFSKGRVLYGMNVTKEGIRRTGEAIIVEGYMDFLMLYQNGVENAVASLGTALTDSQISLLRRYAERPIICYDADTAGEAATMRGLDLLVERDVEPRILVLPSGDPDSYIREYGKDAFAKLAEGALPLMDYHFRRVFSKLDRNTNEGKQKIVAELLPVIGKLKNEVKKSIYLKKLAEELELLEKYVYAEYDRILQAFSERDFTKKSVTETTGLSDMAKAESMIVRLMLGDSSFIPVIRKNLELEDFENPGYKKIVDNIFRIFEESGRVDFKVLMDCLGDEKLAGIASMLSLQDELGIFEDEGSGKQSDRERMLGDCVRKIREGKFIKRKKTIEKEIRQAEKEKSAEKLQVLLLQYQELEKDHRAVNSGRFN
ncbi:DNA primase [Candidatus Desantisbacteria bacterium CG_4_10_14_0_8_um_filter_48_22]|uniref:DNA primase n=1 Tax=Candidatus Desantisbacteria bacterium CG_4_10_14_0_8_um_filter_48_22 TaxID=1974543 RepID=A0A2M7SBJ8_9BACT|nr:MAG: DNA primase [Candidatus Desantisbacteria bacterium CG1_02_49_89]PIV56500.1 MAG: DNA primase [Candidatus Desantisbacteria bacterium CG02_land_8_20_14_3_00_49_13]PIZ16871.1 MAG: DNA primase [Candidatus Desantisbacteria bacterium CG_4_10_14_0_8_um_filter_48_22]PJB27934.1 MAG: DNA primase [Candidatus Desantisbacteria bacterium CG_4_9_14_3_um_filter_50_7]